MGRTPMQTVISASRRTDIPAFYMPWFMEGVRRGAFHVRHPYTGRRFEVPADSATVHSIVFWSKDYGPFLNAGCGPRLMEMGYHLFFNFTVNTPDPMLEPGVPPLSARLAQMSALARLTSPAAVQWRFDPITVYRRPDGRIADNTAAFETIADAAAACGVTRCITSFMDHYAKTRRRWAGMPGAAFVNPTADEKIPMLRRLFRIAAARGIALQACCESDLLAQLPEDLPVPPAACIPSDLLMAIYGGRLSMAADGGQRRAAGCGCRTARDIGSYHEHPCHHNCRYCYANPTSGRNR